MKHEHRCVASVGILRLILVTHLSAQSDYMVTALAQTTDRIYVSVFSDSIVAFMRHCVTVPVWFTMAAVLFPVLEIAVRSLTRKVCAEFSHFFWQRYA